MRTILYIRHVLRSVSNTDSTSRRLSSSSNTVPATKCHGVACEPLTGGKRPTQFSEALTGYATSYADQVERDYDVFLKACRTGELQVRSDEDMAADFRV
jgi:hypothetical protein